MQYDEPSWHRPFGPHSPEQQSPFAVQTLFAVTQDELVEMGRHVPPLQLPVQQSFPATGQAAPTVKHCSAPQWPEMQAPLQQSVLPTQAAAAGAQLPIDEAHVPATGSHTPEQHGAPDVHGPP
jgi:hypothetical protein